MTDRRRLGITVPFDLPLARHADVVARLTRAGCTDLWSMETAGLDALTPLVALAPMAPEARLGSAIASVFARGPALLAMSATAVAEAAPGRFALGIGASSPVLVSDWNSVAYDNPVARVRDTATFLRAAFAGERVDAEYETFTVRGFRLERPPATPPPVLVGALRPAMLRVAGEFADGAILNWLSVDDVRRTAPLVHECGDGKEIVARLFVCPSTDTDTVRTAARRLIAGYLTVPGYAAFHRWLGRTDDLAAMWYAWSAGDRRTAVAAVPDHVIDDLVVHGSPGECADHVARYVAAGVDTPVLAMLPLDPTVDLVAAAAEIARSYSTGSAS